MAGRFAGDGYICAVRTPFLLAVLGGWLAGRALAQTPLKVGDALPDFVLPRVLSHTGGTFTPAESAGKVLVLEFWSTACNLKLLMREALRQCLPVQATRVPTTKPAYVLRRLKNTPPQPASSQPEYFSVGGGEFTVRDNRLEDLRGYLENELRLPVVNETGLTGRYDVAFAVQQEDLKNYLATTLTRLGLELVEAPRKIQLLRLTPTAALK